MAGVMDRMAALWRRWRPAQDEATMAAGRPGADAPAVMLFNLESGRRAVVKDCRAMVEDDPRPDEILATLARDVMQGGFVLRVEGARAAAAQAVADDLVERLGLVQRLDDWVRLTLRDGDSFLEVGATDAGEIVSMTRKPTLEMVRASNQFDQFEAPERAFYWSEMPGAAGAGAVWFAEWQIIHARWKHDEGSRYGRPALGAARRAFKRMTQGELDIAVRRKTRSGLRYAHVLEDASQAEIEAYKVANRAALDDPFAAVADFFLNKRGTIQAIQGDAHLSEIEDVLHHVDTFGVASPVPLELIGYGRNLNRDVLAQKKEQYEESITAVRQWVTAELIRPLVERQWLLAGIWPEGLALDVVWKAKKQSSPADLAEMARFAAAVKAANLLTGETLLRVMATVLPDFDVEAELAALAAEEDERMTMALRIAGNGEFVGARGEEDDDPADDEASDNR
jgi:hypothetical protein